MNGFKERLKRRERQTGFWLSSGSPTIAEVAGGAGFDFLVIDTEHTPNEIPDVLAILRALSGYDVAVVVRPPAADAVAIKRLLDIGVINLLLPMIDGHAQAKAAVAATCYPPRGVRGVSQAQRANRYGRTPNYFVDAHAEIALILQIETRAAVGVFEEIATTDGVDALFIGPADLAADFGHLGDPLHEQMLAVIVDLSIRAQRASIPLGILSATPALSSRFFDQGISFIATGTDLGEMRKTTDRIALETKGAAV
jgi:2-keto-3-deoxy-L-rhamnonate aldolase RhmA